MKFLVLGATGMAGHMVALVLRELGHEVTGFSRRGFPYCDHIYGDAMNADQLVSVLRDREFDVVINCVGILNRECDNLPSRAVYLNSYLPHLLADLIRGTSTRLIHLSTDCVFSGRHGGYSEDSFQDSTTLYGRSKALGEVVDGDNLTLRTSIIGPDMSDGGIGLLNWFMKQHGTVCGYRRAIWTGVTTLTLANAIGHAASQGTSGLYHLVNNETISKFRLLQLLNTHIRDGSVDVIPDDGIQYDKSLVDNRRELSSVVPSYEQMIIEMKGWIVSHMNLYPDYYRGAKPVI